MSSKARVSRHWVYEHLRSRIIRLGLPPGTLLSENEISAELGVSRTPVREALVPLRDEGLVEVLPQVGTYVTRVDPRRVSEAQFLREAVELASLRSITTPLDKDRLSELRENLDEQAALGRDMDRFFELDEEFHKGLMALAGHERSWRVVSSAKGHLDRARHLGPQDQSIGERTAEHRAVFEAVAKEAFEDAETLLQRHLRIVFQDIKDVQNESPHLFVMDADALPTLRSIIVWESPSTSASSTHKETSYGYN